MLYLNRVEVKSSNDNLPSPTMRYLHAKRERTKAHSVIRRPLPVSSYQEPQRSRTILKLELGPDPVRPTLPLPFLPTAALNALVYPPQLQCESWSQLLKPCPDLFSTFHWFAIRTHYALLCRSLIAKYVSVPAEKYEIALIVEGDDLPTLEVRLLGPQCLEKVGRKETKRSAEIVEDELEEISRLFYEQIEEILPQDSGQSDYHDLATSYLRPNLTW